MTLRVLAQATNYQPASIISHVVRGIIYGNNTELRPFVYPQAIFYFLLVLLPDKREMLIHEVQHVKERGPKPYHTVALLSISDDVTLKLANYIFLVGFSYI